MLAGAIMLERKLVERKPASCHEPSNMRKTIANADIISVLQQRNVR